MKATVVVAGLVCTVALTGALRAQAPAAEPRIWQGIFTKAQADRGKETYTSACIRCHGGDLMGVTAPPLTGDRFFASWGGESVDRLFVKIRDTMPPTFGTAILPDTAKLEIVAYILQTNGFPAGSAELAVGSPDLASAQLVKRGEQAAVQNFSLVQTVGCLARAGDRWTLTRTAEPVSTRDDAPTAQGLQAAAARPLGSRTFWLLSAVPFDPASHVGEKMEARGLIYNDPADSRLTLTSLKSTGASCG